MNTFMNRTLARRLFVSLPLWVAIIYVVVKALATPVLPQLPASSTLPNGAGIVSILVGHPVDGKPCVAQAAYSDGTVVEYSCEPSR
jgi:hypothetical protein